MIKTILIWLLVAMAVALVALWLWGGGYAAIRTFVRTIPNPIDILWGTSTSTYKINFPWEIAPPSGADISGLTGDGREEESSGTSDGDTVPVPVSSDRSPFAGMVALLQGSARESPTASEYVEIQASSNLSGTVAISGWSLQSLISGKRVIIPQATATFIMGTVNSVGPISLESGHSAIITTGVSPVGVSFRENICSGYLAQLQPFDPALANACPSNSDIPLTAENLQRYGEDCYDFIRTIPQCDYPTRMPATLTNACRSYIANTFTYNGCVNNNRTSSNFGFDVWRAYVGASAELWKNSHDVIRLLDGEGRLVASISY